MSQPTQGEQRLLTALNLTDGTETTAELAQKLDRHDEIFIELIRLRRELVRTRFHQVKERRRIQQQIDTLKREQERL